MRIIRHCTERLPRGERAWRRLAQLAGYEGVVQVFGYGTGGPFGRVQRRKSTGVAVGFFITNPTRIQVWVPSKCGIRDKFHDEPFETFAHELAHFMFWRDGTDTNDTDEELRADRKGRNLIAQLDTKKRRGKKP